MSIGARFLALLLPAIIFFPGHVFADEAAPQTSAPVARLAVTAPVSSSPSYTVSYPSHGDTKIMADAGNTAGAAGQSDDTGSVSTDTKPRASGSGLQKGLGGDTPTPVTSSVHSKPAPAANAADEASSQDGASAGAAQYPGPADSTDVDSTNPSSFVKDDTATVVSSPDTSDTAPATAAGPAAGQPAKPAVAPLDLKAAESGGLLAPVARDVQYFSITVKKHFQQWLARSGRYMSLMKSILRENYMPEDLVFLALIESGFNPKAYSLASAAGPWQFIKGTAIRYGLRVDQWVDERRDPIKSTEAAAAYLKDLYGQFGSWPLAMASYNAGEGNVERAITRTGGVEDFWKLRKTRYIPAETKDYVPKFIAARMIAQNPDNFGFKDLEYDKPFVFDEVHLDHCTDLRTVALCCGVSLDEIKELNPELIKGCTPPNRVYTLRIPKGKKEQFLAAYNSLPKNERYATPKILTADARYVVRRTAPLSAIARRLGVPVRRLAAVNHLRERTRVRRGRRLLVPRERLVIAADIPHSLPKTGSEAASDTKAEANADAQPVPYASTSPASPGAAEDKPLPKKIELGSLLPPVTDADAAEPAPADIIRVEKVSDDSAVSGTATDDSSNDGADEPHAYRHHHAEHHYKRVASTYRVKRGDTLDSIARRHHTTAAKLARLNRLGRRRRIKAGQTLRLSRERVEIVRKSSRHEKRTASVSRRHGRRVASASRRHGRRVARVSGRHARPSRHKRVASYKKRVRKSRKRYQVKKK